MRCGLIRMREHANSKLNAANKKEILRITNTQKMCFKYRSIVKRIYIDYVNVLRLE